MDAKAKKRDSLYVSTDLTEDFGWLFTYAFRKWFRSRLLNAKTSFNYEVMDFAILRNESVRFVRTMVISKTKICCNKDDKGRKMLVRRRREDSERLASNPELQTTNALRCVMRLEMNRARLMEFGSVPSIPRLVGIQDPNMDFQADHVSSVLLPMPVHA